VPDACARIVRLPVTALHRALLADLEAPAADEAGPRDSGRQQPGWP